MIDDLHPVTAQITQLLDEHDCSYETFEHDPVRTSEEAAHTRPGYSLNQGAKAIILRVKRSKKDKFFIMLILPANLQFDKQKVKAYFEAKDIRFATEDEVIDLTDGVMPGGVPPFGNLFGLPVHVTPQLFDNERIVFNAGDPRFSVAMYSKDFRRLVELIVFEFV